MISVAEAVSIVLKEVSPLPGENVPIADAVGRVLFVDVRTGQDVPAFPNSAMDGYAVRWQDVARASAESPVILKVLEQVSAGYVARREVTGGTAIKIMTGAPIPRGADSVVRVEHTEAIGDHVRVNRVDGFGSHVREAGEDIKKGQVVLKKGKLLSPADVGLLASIGKKEVRVYRRPRVAVVSTGDELLELGESPQPGKIVNSNRYTLIAAIQQSGALPVPFGIVRDQKRRLAITFRKALDCDVVLTTGGVSAGDYDFVKEVLSELGVRMRFTQVAQRPGHPLAFGLRRKTVVFGLPGNPASSTLSFYLFARPALLKMMGHQNIFLRVIRAILEHEIRKRRGVKEFIRCRLRHDGGRTFAASAGAQGAGILSSLSLADGLIVAQEEETLLDKGQEVPVVLFPHQDLNGSEMGF